MAEWEISGFQEWLDDMADRPGPDVSLKEAYLFGKKWLAGSITAHIPQGKGPGAAIRRKCLECTNGQLAEITHCPITNCPLWPYRSGKNPFHARSRLDDAGPDGA